MLILSGLAGKAGPATPVEEGSVAIAAEGVAVGVGRARGAAVAPPLRSQGFGGEVEGREAIIVDVSWGEVG